jgi:hypothetical protein
MLMAQSGCGHKAHQLIFSGIFVVTLPEKEFKITPYKLELCIIP